MTPSSADVVVCGAGIAGAATAYHLAVRRQLGQVVICDPLPPLSLTSDESTEAYRNWWPSRPMVAFMNRSIDLLEELALETGNAIRLNRRGYLFVTADRDRLTALRRQAEAISVLGAGPLRIHTGRPDDPPYRPSPSEEWRSQPDGADLFMDAGVLHRRFPGLAEAAVGALHVRRAGWLSAHQLGTHLLERAREAGAVLVPDRVIGIRVDGGRVAGADLEGGDRISTRSFVNAAGPHLAGVSRLLGEELPVHTEVHHKVAFRDPLVAMARDAPMMIWNDPQELSWTTEERALLAAEGREDLLGELPPACHGRPEGGPDSPWVLALWEYRRHVCRPTWPLPRDPLYPEVVLRGMRTMIPALTPYLERMPRPVVDGGYYTKTAENRPLIGPTRIPGSYVVGALSGFGIMAACAAGELAAAHVTGSPLPDHAPAFRPDRYDDPGYRAELDRLDDTGQI